MKIDTLKSPVLQTSLLERTEKITERHLTVAELWNIQPLRRERA